MTDRFLTVGGSPSRRKRRLAQETCVFAECKSACGSGSRVVVPTFQDEFHFIRVGGEFGSEPSGTIRLTCELDDCNGNNVPDFFEIDSGVAKDCNGNGDPDLSCDIAHSVSKDCNCNGVPDECEMNGNEPIDCSGFGGPCESGPFFCFDEFACAPDANENGIPDCCDAGELPAVCPDCPVDCRIENDLNGVVFADADPIAPLVVDQPGHCDIDAREPHDIGDLNARNGWDRMVMSFACDPAAIGRSGLAMPYIWQKNIMLPQYSAELTFRSPKLKSKLSSLYGTARPDPEP